MGIWIIPAQSQDGYIPSCARQCSAKVNRHTLSAAPAKGRNDQGDALSQVHTIQQ
jgi:hypothetical protein